MDQDRSDHAPGPRPRVVPVVDLRGGLAVHARGGDRDQYRPVATHLHPGADPIGLARAFRDRLGLAELYVADLDALAGLPPSIDLYRGLLDSGIAPWVDPGVRRPADARAALDAGPIALILGTETVSAAGVFAEILADHGPGRVVFGLDLRHGRPIVSPGPDPIGHDPASILARAAEIGFRRFLLLDLGRVGAGTGVGNAALLAHARRDHPGVEISVGGGVSGPADLLSLGRLGIDAALVGSALLDGRIGPADLR